MECHRIRVLPYSTFRLNVSATRPYNADFDGDEMNMHVPQSIPAAMELKYLASVLRQIISPRTNSPIIQIFQDTLTGSYRITQPNTKIPEYIAMNLLARMRRPLSSYVRKNDRLTGHEVMSNAFPIMDYEGKITLKDGKLVKGVLGKDAFGKTSEGIIHVLYNDFSPKRAGDFINDIQSIVTKYNLFAGFSVGAGDLIADEATEEFIKVTLAEGRQKVADILSSVHSGTFNNTAGRSDGAELENQIMNALKEINSKIEEKVGNSLPKDNRMVQMVESKAKGSNLNITQMLALLGQQMVAGQRIKYTLQDRTLPHFARYDHGIESRGFVENSFISGLRPAEFFFHAMGGREGLIDTAVKTSDSGYIQRKLVKMMEDLHVEYDGTVRNVNGSIFQFVYGGDGVDSVSIETQPIDLGVMILEQVYKDFAASANDFRAVMSTEPSEDPPDLLEKILEDRDVLVRNVFRFQKKSEVSAPVHLKRLITKYANPYALKTDLTPEYVVGELQRLTEEPMIKPNYLFHILLRYYLAPKKSIIVLRLTQAMFDELLKDIRFKYMKARVHPGEMVGTLAAQSIGEPTTQLTLNTFHSAGTAKANATQGVPRIVELLSVSHNPKNPSDVIYLKPDIAMDSNAVFYKMKEIQKTTLRDITKSVRIYYDPDPSAKGTSIEDDKDIIESYQRFSVTNQTVCTSPWIVRLELNPKEMTSRCVTDMNMISTKISNNKVLRVFECIHSDSNTPNKLIMRIAFLPDVVKNSLSLRFIEEKLLDTVLTGVSGIGRVYRRDNNKELILDEKVGGYVPNKQYVIDVDGLNLLDLATIEGVDPYRSFSNDVHEIMDVFGVETARLALYREFMEVFTTEYVNYHHMITLVDTMTYPGYLVTVDRFGMKKSNNGVLAKSSFEETSQILFDAAISADFDKMKGVSANIMFGQKPPCGTGFVNVLVDETKLPEGAEEDMSAFDTDLNAANVAVAQEEDTGMCRMEDVLMEW
jgi:DNA-directed RNA polymerase II subunit RPB1